MYDRVDYILNKNGIPRKVSHDVSNETNVLESPCSFSFHFLRLWSISSKDFEYLSQILFFLAFVIKN